MALGNPSLYHDEALLEAKAAKARLSAVRAHTEALAKPLSPEDMVIQSMPDASPTKWHLAHTTWFFETFILKAFAKDYTEFDDNYCFLFNSYYECVGERHPRAKRGMLTRPPLEDIFAYRKAVTNAMTKLLGSAEGTKDWGTIVQLLDLGCHHEEQHQELLLTDIKHALYQNSLKPAYASDPAPEDYQAPKLSWASFDEGVYEIGHQGKGFAFDCEGPHHKVYLNAFQIASRPISNAEYLAFMEDEGYRNADLWLADGWAHINENALTHPLYWEHKNDGWHSFTMRGMRPLNPGEPVGHLSYYEADAFARWAGARLPTEAEHEVMALKKGTTEAGELWEWTGSAYTCYPGFKPAPGAVGEYNGKFMVGQMVLRGGSGATPSGHWRPTYRNFFYPPDAWQFTGVRLAKDI